MGGVWLENHGGLFGFSFFPSSAMPMLLERNLSGFWAGSALHRGGNGDRVVEPAAGGGGGGGCPEDAQGPFPTVTEATGKGVWQDELYLRQQ